MAALGYYHVFGGYLRVATPATTTEKVAFYISTRQFHIIVIGHITISLMSTPLLAVAYSGGSEGLTYPLSPQK